MSSLNLICRYLRAREDINATYGILADMIEADPNQIDAVEIEKKDLPTAQFLLKNSTELDFCFLNIDNHFILFYPNEQREQYMNLQPFLVYGKELIIYGGLTYSEALEVKEFMDVAGIHYKSETTEDGKIKFIVSKEDAAIAKEMIEALDEEEHTEEGKKYFQSKNICWAHALRQASIAINGNEKGTTFIGTEGGTGGLAVREDGAVLITQGKQKYIARSDIQFANQMIHAILYDLNGVNAPVKAFHGDVAELLTRGMSKEDMYKPVFTLKQALEALQLSEIPAISELDKMINHLDEYSEQEKYAFYAIARMAMCRKQTLEAFQEYKLTKKDKNSFLSMHQEFVDKFASLNASNIEARTQDMEPVSSNLNKEDEPYEK